MEGFARVELLPSEFAARVTKGIVWFRVVIIRRIFSGSSRFAGQLRRQGLGIFRWHGQLRIDRIKDEQPLVLNFDLIAVKFVSARKLQGTKVKNIPFWQYMNQQRLLAFPILQNDPSEDVSLKILQLDDFSNGKL